MLKLAKRGSQISASKTLAIAAKAKSMIAEGKNVIMFTVGEPDFPTPENIKDAAFKAINNNFTKYTAASGIVELKQAVVDKYKKDFGVSYETGNIIISSGAKQALTNAIMATCEEGDEVLIPVPAWVSYPEIVKLSGAKPIFIDAGADNNYKITPESLKAAITAKTKLLILCSPSNPTGVMYTEAEIRELGKIIKEAGIYVIFDEIYEKLVYKNNKHFSMTQIDDIRDQVISINGVSKSHAMTGWRIGYAVASKEIIAICNKIQSHMSSNPNSIAQKAAVEAIAGDQKALEEMLKVFAKRRDLGLEKLQTLENVKVIEPDGAFYFYADFSHYFGKKAKDFVINNNDDLAKYFLEEYEVAVVSGSAFGTTKDIRFSFACSEEDFIEGIERIKKALENLK